MSNTDKLNRLLANIIEFNTGERLSKDKLNALVEILDENLSHISGAIGDIYDENYDEQTEEAHRSLGGKKFGFNQGVVGAKRRRFDIANLARLIGPASNLNPQAVNLAPITEVIPVGTKEYTLKHTILGIGSIPDYTHFDSDFTSETQYKIIDDRKILFSKALTEDKPITYTTAPHLRAGGPNYQGARFNVYPDPNQADDVNKLQVFYNAPVADANSPTYTITLPTIADQQISLADGTTSELDNRDINHNQQLLLPEWICDLDDNTDLPSYSLYLKNYSTNESYVDATYTKVDSKTILVSNLNIGNQNCINGFDLRIITVGTDITTSIDDLRNKMYLHSHDGSFGEPPVHIKTLAGIFEGDAPSGVYAPATEDWNPLPNYLHRDGWRTTNGDVNGDNAMRGNLLMGLTSFDPINSKSISDTSSTSYGVFFGSSNTGIARYNSDLNIYNSNSTIVTATTINNIASAVTINTDSFVVEVNDSGNSLTLKGQLAAPDGVSVILSDTEEQSLVTQEDITSTTVKTTRRKIVKNSILAQIDLTNVTVQNDWKRSHQNYDYIDAFNVLESYSTATNNQNAKFIKVGNYWVNDPDVDTRGLESYFWEKDSSEAIIKSMYASEQMTRLFVSSLHLNSSYIFKLWKSYGNNHDRIYSFAYRIDAGSVGYRKFDLHIDRATPLLLNYDSIDEDYIYEHEFIVDIDLLSIGNDNPLVDVGWKSIDGEATTVEINNASPFVVLNYSNIVNNGMITLASENRTYALGNGENYSLPHDIENIYVSCPNLDELNTSYGRTILGEDMVHVFEGDIYIRVGRNVKSSTGNETWGVLEFDKLYIKERIYNNDLFVEITGHQKSRVAGGEVNFGRWKNTETPV